MCYDASTEESNFDYSRENGLCCDHLKHDADWKLAQCTSGSGVKIVSRVNCLLGICSHMSAVTAQHPKCLKVSDRNNSEVVNGCDDRKVLMLAHFSAPCT